MNISPHSLLIKDYMELLESKGLEVGSYEWAEIEGMSEEEIQDGMIFISEQTDEELKQLFNN